MSEDFNFLGDDKKKNKNTNSILIAVVRIASFIITGILIFCIGKVLYEMYDYNKKINADTAYLEDSNTIKELQDHEQYLNDKNELQAQKKDYTLLNTYANLTNTGNKVILDLVSGIFTEGIYFERIDMMNGEVVLTGVASDIDIIANYEIVLRNSEYVEDLHVINIADESERNTSIVLPDERYDIDNLIEGHAFSIRFKFKNEILNKTGSKN